LAGSSVSARSVSFFAGSTFSSIARLAVGDGRAGFAFVGFNSVSFFASNTFASRAHEAVLRAGCAGQVFSASVSERFFASQNSAFGNIITIAFFTVGSSTGDASFVSLQSERVFADSTFLFGIASFTVGISAGNTFSSGINSESVFAGSTFCSLNIASETVGGISTGSTDVVDISKSSLALSASVRAGLGKEDVKHDS